MLLRCRSRRPCIFPPFTRQHDPNVDPSLPADPCSFPPFYDEDLPALFDSILKANFDFPSPWWDPVSGDAKRIIKNGLLVLDHEKRLTAKQVKEDTWILNAADNNLIEAQKAMKKYNATRKLRKVAQGIIAQNRMQRALEQLRGGMGSASIKDPVEAS